MWQPIETAPKDKKVLLYSPRHGVVCGCWNECMFFRNPRPYWTHDRERLYGVRAVRDNPPTHWMPLPELPGVQPAPSVPDFANTKDAARYRWLRENGLANEKRESRAVLPRGGKKASMAFRYWTTPEELDMTIDAMISAAPEAKP